MSRAEDVGGSCRSMRVQDLLAILKNAPTDTRFNRSRDLSGADLGFSRGGGADFQKKIENFDDLLFF